ncbi:MARH6 [Enterospora canceri]|uniref:RING-type E3 ubiquitin transferase n=1 Tax=Enterospora canceri TaxID=1081671 RepID=A0A1Y1S7C5_9MICR|nr:MARH6 [Enterospora canceri]
MSNASLEMVEEVPKCKICHEEQEDVEPLFHPCKCKGSMKFIHDTCLREWIKGSKEPSCGICGHKFTFKSVYKENTPKRLPA